MKPKLLKFALPIGMGLMILIITIIGLLSITLVGCLKTDGGNGTTAGCTPKTGCGVEWLGSLTQLCYGSSNDCHLDGNNTCRQCY